MPTQINGSIYGYLTVFHAIVTKGSIAAAARKLQIASPSVSHLLKLPEQHIGLPLFNRTTRKIELTEAGLISILSQITLTCGVRTMSFCPALL